MSENTEAVAPLDLRGVGWQLVTDVSGQPIGPISRTPENGAMVYPETSVRKYLYSLHNNPEERSSQ